MDTHDFDYYRPQTIMDACMLHQSLKAQRKTPVYFSGGTEIITLGRLNMFITNAVIDIKGIPECQMMEFNQQYLVLGAALPLAEIEGSNTFPLLRKTVSAIADHTARNKITLGGNINANIFYREAVLPLLLTDSLFVIAGLNGIKTVSIHDVFDEFLQLKNEELLVQVLIHRQYLHLPFISVKKHKQWNTGYPLVTIAALKVDHEIRVAFSGLCPFPFRSRKVEIELNRQNLAYEERINQAFKHLPEPLLDDIQGSKAYRLFVLKNTLYDVLIGLEDEENATI
jgi:CO/xanthine dehydrogenase FAD-binding subunit